MDIKIELERIDREHPCCGCSVNIREEEPMWFIHLPNNICISLCEQCGRDLPEYMADVENEFRKNDLR